MRVTLATATLLTLLLAACGQSNPPPAPAPAAVTAPSAATAAGSVAAPAAVTGEGGAEAEEEGPEQAGDVVLAQGSVTDTAVDGSTRTLKDGDDVFPGDSFTLGDESYLDIDFSDGGRILLRPNSSFQIQEYHFDPDAHPNADVNSGETLLPPTAPAKPESSFFKLIKGGLRAVDGLIGQTHHEDYGIETPVATIGVRGTAFDVRYCGDDCKDEADSSGTPDNGLYTAVSEGSIDAKNDAGEAVIPAGQSSFVQTRHHKAQVSTRQHRALRHMSLPDKLKARDDGMRVKVKAKQHARRKAQLERRRQRAERLKQLKQHPQAKAGVQGKQQAKPGGKLERREERRQGQGKPGQALRQRAAEHGKEPGARQGPGHAGKRLHGDESATSRPGVASPKKGRGLKAEPAEPKPFKTKPAKPDKKPPPKADKQPPPKPAAGKSETKRDDVSCKGKKKKKDKDKCGG